MDVEFIAEEICLSTSEQELVSEAVDAGEMESYHAFDLRFEADGEELEPKEGHSVSITFEADLIETDAVVHIKDDKTVETVESDITEEKITFEADNFSRYVLTSFSSQSMPEDQKFLYKDCAYGSLRTPTAYNFIDYIKEENGRKPAKKWNNGRVALRVFHQNNQEYAPKEIGPADDGKAFVYGWSETVQYFTFEVTAPENYYIARVSLYDYTSEEFYKNAPKAEVRPEGNQTVYKVDFTLRQMYGTDDRVANALVIDLRPITAKLDGNISKYVDNVKLVNYKNGTPSIGDSCSDETHDHGEMLAFGKQFMFGSGRSGAQNNHCDSGKVYQGLATDTLADGIFDLSSRFKAANSKKFFPSEKECKSIKDAKGYITDYYDNARVQFNRDADGFWTMDSGQYMYTANESGQVTPKPLSNFPDKKETQFRPFGVDEYHFGMMMPIGFCIAEDGLTEEGKPAVFKFSGDDDVFVYIDGKLVLDLGGVHNAVKGQIDFQKGSILIQGQFENALYSSVDDTCYSHDKARGYTAKTDISSYAEANLWNYLGVSSREEFSEKDHILTVVYFERGAHDSNCKISYNFTKTENRTFDFRGLKVDENKRGLANAQFTLYTNEECSEDSIPLMGVGVPAIAYSDADGTIAFEGLSAGAIPRGSDRIEKTYYLKETKAPEGYSQAEGALWRLVLTAYEDGSQSQRLYALNTAALALSYGNWWGQVYDNHTEVKAIRNYPTNYAKKLTVSKKVTYPGNRELDPNADYVFRIDQAIDGVYRAYGEKSYKIGDKTYKTNAYGQFALKAGEAAVFENLMEKKYKVSEICVLSKKGYSINNYDTKITIDNDQPLIYKQDEQGERFVLIDFETTWWYWFTTVASEKVVEFENILVKTYDWQLMKISKSSKAALLGAEFKLTPETKGSTDTYYGKSNDSGIVQWYASVNDRDKNRNPIEVPLGSYLLSETKAPGGYAKSEDVWHLVIDNQNGIQAYINNPGDLEEKTVYEQQYGENNAVNTIVKLSFEDEVAYTLPATGGRGSYPYTIGGVLLMMLATLLLYKKNNVMKEKLR